MQIDDFINGACETINQKNSALEAIAKKLLPLKQAQAPDSVETIICKASKPKLSCTAAGVDSGFVSKKLSFMDLALIKTAGVLFTFENNSLKKADYFPAAFSFPVPVLLKSGLEKNEEQQSLSLERLKHEIDVSIKMIEKFKPNYLFIDGSIVPQYQDKPHKESEINSDYSSIIHLFQHLYTVAEKNSCKLVACVEDSRGNRFRQLLQEEILSVPSSAVRLAPTALDGQFDAYLLDFLLAEGERTFAFPYTKNVENHAILKDYSPEWSKSIYVFYLKPAFLDKPLRIEFICKKESQKAEELKKCVEEISGIVFALSSLHREYAFPSVLIEADLRAGLSEQEINTIYDKLIDKLGPKMRMRRNNRPFG